MIGLIRGDCQELHAPGHLYCYYHRKVQDGLIEVDRANYPVWPLPTVAWRLTGSESISA